MNAISRRAAVLPTLAALEDRKVLTVPICAPVICPPAPPTCDTGCHSHDHDHDNDCDRDRGRDNDCDRDRDRDNGCGDKGKGYGYGHGGSIIGSVIKLKLSILGSVFGGFRCTPRR